MASKGNSKSTREDARVSGRPSLKNVPAYVTKWLNRNIGENKKVIIADRRKRLNSFPTKFVCTDEELHRETARSNMRESRSFESMASIAKLKTGKTRSDGHDMRARSDGHDIRERTDGHIVRRVDARNLKEPRVSTLLVFFVHDLMRNVRLLKSAYRSICSRKLAIDTLPCILHYVKPTCF